MSNDDEQRESDEITNAIQYALEHGDDPLNHIAKRLHAAAVAGDREAIRTIRAEIKAEDNDISRGMTFTIKRDALDPRWDIVIVRLPNASFGGREPMPEHDLKGQSARWRFIRWAIATVGGVASMLGAPPEFEMALKLLHKEAQIQSSSVDNDA